jgi:hypothetical protein
MLLMKIYEKYTITTVPFWLFTVLRPAYEFFTYTKTSPLPSNGCNIYTGLCSALRAFEQGDLYRATPAVTQDLGFSCLIRRTAPFSRLLRHTTGCRGSIITRIFTITILVWHLTIIQKVMDSLDAVVDYFVA